MILINFQDSVVTLLLERLRTFLKLSRKMAVPGSTPMFAKTCIHPDCHIGANASVRLGNKKWEKDMMEKIINLCQSV